MISYMASKYDFDFLDDDFSELPTDWPDDDAISSDDVYFIQIQDEKSVELYNEKISNNPLVYPMKNVPRGNVLVINNERFPHPHERKGTEKDTHKITTVFNKLGFNVIVYNNLTKDDMEKTFLRASKDDYSTHDCLIIFILSHGDKGIVFGIDGNFHDSSNSLSIFDITKLFSDTKSLLGKPKLFFIQACQGKDHDKGKTLDDELNKKIYLENEASFNTSELHDSSLSNSFKFNDYMNDEEEMPDGPKIPSEADIFISTASVEGYVSWRNKKYGSWYVQAIGYVFRKFAYKCDLNQLMTMVNHLVSKSESISHKCKQVVAKYDTLRKTFYFVPYAHERNMDNFRNYKKEKAEKDNLKEKFDAVCMQLEDLTKKCNEGKINLADREKEIGFLKTQNENEKSQRRNLEIALMRKTEENASVTRQLEREQQVRNSLENKIDPMQKLRELGKVQEQQLLRDLNRQRSDIANLKCKLDKENEMS